ncbi:phage regulatory CII family protein [Desulfovibrio inopinatus]|uniref:phage regulatory CII family protein n=1 Tax=Desulfovibrio inopinatus TaxID=102109 RepID=UPI0006840DAF|nr:phage regulatory CII family protein [Desulfovibrio inopinatus]
MCGNLLQVVHDCVIESPNGVSCKAIAESLGKRYPTLMAELNPEQESHKLGIELLIPIMQQTGSTTPLEYMAQRMGGVFVPLPKISEEHANIKSIEALREFTEFMTVVADAWSDGKITKAELERIDTEGGQAVAAIEALRLQAQKALESQTTATLQAVGASGVSKEEQRRVSRP